jgi:hypothetical protein
MANARICKVEATLALLNLTVRKWRMVVGRQPFVGSCNVKEQRVISIELYLFSDN